ncbi:MAG: hypothetical protein SXV54_10290 [Chloroflexota bacterium]|nr:hypothetical protein [Chloroflexota bacterium]
MTEKQSAETFSEQVDALLAGQTPPGLDQDPLLSLAVELTANPASAMKMNPSPVFTQRLRRQLLSSLPQGRAIRSRHRWPIASIAGVSVTLLLALVLTLVWSPGTPSVTEVLARAADAVAITPGQVTYTISKLEVEGTVADNLEDVYSTIQEYWTRAGTLSDGRLISVEVAGNVYVAGDTDLTHPQVQHYSTPSKLCMRSLNPAIHLQPNLDAEGCFAVGTPTRSDPDPMAIYAGENLRDWISRMRADVAEIEFHEDRFNDRPVYSLTYREAGHRTQSPITVNHTTTGTIVALGSKLVPSTIVTYTVTLYIDRETYLPVGVISKADDPNMVLTQTILGYQVLNPTDLDFDPFAWPPER